jgi:Bacterial Ig-like domain (group 3)
MKNHMNQALLLLTISGLLIGSLLTTAAMAQGGGALADHQGGAGGAARKAVHVPFKRGPFGPDGKVHQVEPPALRTFPHETETPQIEEGRALAAAGIFTLTDKKPSQTLNAQQLSLLNWDPGTFNPAENSSLLDLFKSPVAPARAAKTAKPSSVPVAGPTFGGISATGYYPPDGGVAAGSLQVVEVVNSTINVYDKNGNLLSSQTLNNFFSFLGTPGSDFLFDPSVFYDMQTGRFWVLAVSENDAPNRSNLLVAVSAADDVTQGWFEYWLDATIDGNNATSNWCDYPHMGIDADAVYLSCNQFGFPRLGKSAGSFQYAKVRIVNKDEFMNAACCNWWDFWNLSDSGGTSFTVRPAMERFTGHGFGDFWVNTVGGGGSGNKVKVWQLNNPTGCCDGTRSISLAGSEQGVGSFGVPPNASQPNFAQALDTGDTRVLFATYQFGHLSYGHTFACTQGGTTTDSCAGFTEIDVGAYPTMTNINDWYYTQPAGEDVFYPFVDQNINSDKTMVYSRSDGSSTYPGAYYTTIPSSATCTFCTGGVTTMQAGSANYVVTDTAGKNRWGDYHGAGTDPDLIGIWVEGEYASATNTWSTDIESTYRSYFPIDSPSPTALSFAHVAIYSSSATQYVTFTNTGNAAMVTSSAYISGDADFIITYNTCGFTTLQVGSNCTLGAVFSPTSVGSGSALLVLLDNTGSGFTTAALSGTGVAAATTTTVSSSPNPSTFGQSVSFSAQVLSLTAGVPTGTVTFYDGLTPLGTVVLGGGVATYHTAGLSGGTHTITGVYSGSGNYLGSRGSTPQAVNRAPTSSTVTSSLNPSTYGKLVTFTTHVTSGVGTPIGTVTFRNGVTVLGAKTLTAGSAALGISTLTAGTHSITVVYGGSSNFAGSTSAVLTETVQKVATTSTVTSSSNPSQYHRTITFTAKVTSVGGVPAGTATFKNGTTALGSVAVNASGIATFSTNALAVGRESITVAYSGNVDFVGSTSAVLTQTVNKATTKTTIASSKNPSTHGTVVTFTATVTAAFGGSATGKVTFKDGATVLGAGTLGAANKATFTTSALAVGTHSITATYPGNANTTGSVSAVLKQVVQ